MLKDLHCVANEAEVDVGELEYVVAEVAFEHCLAGALGDEGGAGGEVGCAGEVGEGEADEVRDVCLGGGEGGVGCLEAEG